MARRSVTQDLRRRGYIEKSAGPAGEGLTRRAFISRAGGLGLALGAPPLITGCQGGNDPEPAPGTESRTLFFNLAHEDRVERPYFLVVQGRHHALTRTQDAPAVLQSARAGNRFLQGVPDAQITHHVEALELPTDICTLAFVGVPLADPDTWQMSGVYQILPNGSAPQAMQRAQSAAGSATLPLSAKRALYGHAPAASVQDLIDEQALLDATDHARTLIGLHPDLLCAQPDGAHHIHTTHILTMPVTGVLARTLANLGPAQPQQAAGQALNDRGWATLQPMLQDDGTPFKNTQGRIQYQPAWHPRVNQLVAAGVRSAHLTVKNDTSLGADVTGLGLPTQPNPALAGKVWHRVDGVANLQPSAVAAAAAAASGGTTWTLTATSSYMGLILPDQPRVGGDTVTLTNATNWFLRSLGVWAQFLDANGKEIKAVDLPSGTFPNRTAEVSPLDKETMCFLGILPPPYTLAGIPIAPAQLSPTIKIPPAASTVRYHFAGLGFNGSWVDPEGITVIGSVFTGLFNMAIVALFMAVGVSTLDAAIKTLIPVASASINALLAFVNANADWPDHPTADQVMGLVVRLLSAILNGFAGRGITELAEAIAVQLVAANVINAIPVAGEIGRAVAAVIGGVSLAETLIEVGLSAPISSFDLVGTHTLQFNLRGDPLNGNRFPEPPAGYRLEYTAVVQFDDGLPRPQPAVAVPDPSVNAIPVRIPAMPRGGKVNVSVGFYMKKIGASASEWCAAKGSTGLRDNTVGTLGDIVTEQIKVPIRAGTVYIHTRRTALDSSGQRVWQADPDGSNAPAYLPPRGGQQPGDLGALRSITVRQDTAGVPGDVGYAWQAFSAGVADCSNPNATGQLDLAANLGSVPSVADRGFARTACGRSGGGTSAGVRVAYSLLGDDARNVWFDGNGRHLRPVSLANPPTFSAAPRSDADPGLSFGQFNFDSTQVLLHPAGHAISISNAFHKLETLRLPPAAMPDATAARNHLARVAGGVGTRPGLMTSPVAAAISADGVVLVLEDGFKGNRLLAFDVGGNPLPYFQSQAGSPHFLPLTSTAGRVYLDLAVEFTGFIYVLSQDPSTSAIQLDIYHPTQADTLPICTTPNLNAGRIAVDYWRSVYALNYEVLRLPDGSVPALTEPSVSVWLPPPPL